VQRWTRVNPLLLVTGAPVCRAHAAGLEVAGAGVQQHGGRTEGVRRSFASAVAAADTIAARTAAARGGGGSLRRPGPGEVRKKQCNVKRYCCTARKHRVWGGEEHAMRCREVLLHSAQAQDLGR
jgi:hypothetical protein